MDSILADHQVSVIVFMVLSAALAIALLELARWYFVTKRTELKFADQALNRHFAAIRIITNDDVVSQSAKRFMLQFSAAVCHKEIAKRIAASIKSGHKPELSPERLRDLESVMDEVKDLMKSRKDIAAAIIEAANFGFASMILRWPETEITIAKTILIDAEVNSDQASFRQKAACVMAQIPDQVHVSTARVFEPA